MFFRKFRETSLFFEEKRVKCKIRYLSWGLIFLFFLPFTASAQFSINCPANVVIGSCATEAQISTAYDAWAAGFVVNDGCNTNSNIADIPALPAFVCGQGVSLSFTLSASDDCDVVPLTCTSTFSVTAAVELTIACPADVNLGACTTEADILTAYSAWAAGFVVNDGCNTNSNIGDVPALPAFVCGGPVDLSFELSATDDCNAVPLTCMSTFSVAASDLSILCPANVNLASCATEAQISAAYDAWAAGFVVTDGCNTVSNIATIPALPAFVCGGAVDLSFTLSATDDCNAVPLTCTSAFSVAAGDALTITCPGDVTVGACSTEAEILAAYTTWAAGFSVDDGCNTTSNIGDIPALPAFVCGASVSLPFTLSVDNDCNLTTTCISTFTVTEALLEVNCPDDVNLEACASDADILAAYTAWVAGFTVTDGCNSVSNIDDIPALPIFGCGEAVSLSFMLSATDDCNAIPVTCMSSFNVSASTPLSINCPADVNLLACATEAEVLAAYTTWAADFSVVGGCNTVSNLADLPALNFDCGEPINLPFTLSVSSDCNSTTTCNATFSVAGSPLVVNCPADINLSACTTEADILCLLYTSPSPRD